MDALEFEPSVFPPPAPSLAEAILSGRAWGKGWEDFAAAADKAAAAHIAFGKAMALAEAIAGGVGPLSATATPEVEPDIPAAESWPKYTDFLGPKAPIPYVWFAMKFPAWEQYAKSQPRAPPE